MLYNGASYIITYPTKSFKRENNTIVLFIWDKGKLCFIAPTETTGTTTEKTKEETKEKTETASDK